MHRGMQKVWGPSVGFGQGLPSCPITAKSFHIPPDPQPSHGQRWDASGIISKRCLQSCQLLEWWPFTQDQATVSMWEGWEWHLRAATYLGNLCSRVTPGTSLSPMESPLPRNDPNQPTNGCSPHAPHWDQLPKFQKLWLSAIWHLHPWIWL